MQPYSNYIILIEFDTFYSSIEPETFLYDGHFIIFFEKGNIHEIEEIFSKLWKIYIYNVNVLATNAISSHLVSLFTFMPFFGDSCDLSNQASESSVAGKSERYRNTRRFTFS